MRGEGEGYIEPYAYYFGSSIQGQGSTSELNLGVRLRLLVPWGGESGPFGGETEGLGGKLFPLSLTEPRGALLIMLLIINIYWMMCLFCDVGELMYPKLDR